MSQPGVKKGVIRIIALIAAPGMQETAMSVITDARLIYGQADTLSINFFLPLFMLWQPKKVHSLIGRTIRLGT